MDSLSFKNGWIRGIERQFLIARSSNYDQYLDCKIVEKKIDVNVKKKERQLCRVFFIWKV